MYGTTSNGHVVAPERSVLALPPEVLRGFSEECIRSLPADVQREVLRQRRDRRRHGRGQRSRQECGQGDARRTT
jgi:hypothetical protein